MDRRSTQRRLERTLRTKTIYVSGFGGLLTGVVGLVIGGGTTTGSVLLAFGVALFAGALLAYLAFTPDDLLDEFLDSGLRETFDNRKVHCTDDFWLDLIKKENEYYRVLGVANHGYISTAKSRIDFTNAFRTALTSSQTFTMHILWLDPRSKLAEIRQAEEQRGTRKDTVESIQWLWELRESLAVQVQGRLKLGIYDETPTCGITWTDDTVVVTHYQARALNLSAPGLVLSTNEFKSPFRRRKPVLTEKYLRNWFEVAEVSTDLTADLVAEVANAVPSFDTGTPSEAELRLAATTTPQGSEITKDTGS